VDPCLDRPFRESFRHRDVGVDVAARASACEHHQRPHAGDDTGGRRPTVPERSTAGPAAVTTRWLVRFGWTGTGAEVTRPVPVPTACSVWLPTGSRPRVVVASFRSRSTVQARRASQTNSCPNSPARGSRLCASVDGFHPPPAVRYRRGRRHRRGSAVTRTATTRGGVCCSNPSGPTGIDATSKANASTCASATRPVMPPW
jgi:hypothetical protein